MRKCLLAWSLALLAGAALGAASGFPASAASDNRDQAACLARSESHVDVSLASRAGADRYDFGWMAEREHFGRKPYIIHVADPESPRSLIQHDRVILPGRPADWVAAPHGADLVLCSRRVPAVVVVERQFCSGPLSVGNVANGEIEEITFLGGTTWLADDLAAQIDGVTMPPELAEDLRNEVAMASPQRHARDPFEPQVISYAPDVAPLVAAWTIVPMSRALGAHAAATLGCLARQADLKADLRDRIMPTNR